MDVKIFEPSIVLTNRVGDGSVISSFCYIENDVVIGRNTKIKPGCFIFDGAEIGDNCFIGPGVYMFNDKKPPSGGDHWARVKIYNDVSIGGRCNIAPGVTIYDHAKIRMGSNVTRDVAPYEYYRGEGE